MDITTKNAIKIGVNFIWSICHSYMLARPFGRPRWDPDGCAKVGSKRVPKSEV